eukprot:jgi/Mesvir1/14930/Mv05520-RA.1
MDKKPPLNINVGILGHVDSGKTSLARAISTEISTAALDKNPQSVARGITLDLGFSAITRPFPPELASLNEHYDCLQFTLVDCPGHASLIRTIIAGAQVIDIMLLVIDVTKGIQTQTAECMILGEVSPTEHLIVVLNKMDLLAPDIRSAQIEKVSKRITATFRAHRSRFTDLLIVPVSACPGAGEGGATPEGLEILIQALCSRVKGPRVIKPGSFLYQIDHCFQIKGQGTILTGTVLQGCVSQNDTIELPELKMQRKVKSMQMFHRPVSRACQGDRVALCVTQLDAKLMERGIAATPGSVLTYNAAVAHVTKVKYYKAPITSKSRFHVTVGHATVMAEVSFFRDIGSTTSGPASRNGRDGASDSGGSGSSSAGGSSKGDSSSGGSGSEFDMTREYLYANELLGRPDPEDSAAPSSTTAATTGGGTRAGGAGKGQNSGSGAQDESGGDEPQTFAGPQWAILRFLTPVTGPLGALLIGSKLDADVHTKSCRLAFYGNLMQPLDTDNPAELQKLRIFKKKRKQGVIERHVDDRTVIVRDMLKKDSDASRYTGMRVTSETGEEGTILGPFGQSGKLKVHFPRGIPHPPEGQKGGGKVFLDFKRFVHDGTKRMCQ